MIDQGEAARAWDLVLRASERAWASNLAIVSALRTAVSAGDVTITILPIDQVINLAGSTASRDLLRTHRYARVTPRTPTSWKGDRLELLEQADATDLVVIAQEREQLFTAALRAARKERVVIAAKRTASPKTPLRVTVCWSAPLPDDDVVRLWTYDNPTDDEVGRLVAAGATDERYVDTKP